MQVVDKNNIEKRILFYWSKMYAQSIKGGDDYSALEKSIVILITDYNLDNLKEIPYYLTKWKIREENHHKLILTDMLEIYIIETDKAKNFFYNKNDTLNSWLQFINNPEVMSGMENEEIKKAKKVLETISQNKREQALTELREKYIRDQNATLSRGYEKGLEAGIEQGVEQGFKQGIEQGIECGIKQEKIEIVKKMHSEKFDVQTIANITGLTEEEIDKIIFEK